jgi:hypothetical protein
VVNRKRIRKLKTLLRLTAPLTKSNKLQIMKMFVVQLPQQACFCSPIPMILGAIIILLGTFNLDRTVSTYFSSGDRTDDTGSVSQNTRRPEPFLRHIPDHSHFSFHSMQQINDHPRCYAPPTTAHFAVFPAESPSHSVHGNVPSESPHWFAACF